MFNLRKHILRRRAFIRVYIIDEEFKEEVNKCLLDIENDNIPENNTEDT